MPTGEPIAGVLNNTSQGKPNFSWLQSGPSDSCIATAKGHYILEGRQTLRVTITCSQGQARNLAKWVCCLGGQEVSGENQGLASGEERSSRGKVPGSKSWSTLTVAQHKTTPLVKESVSPGTLAQVSLAFKLPNESLEIIIDPGISQWSRLLTNSQNGSPRALFLTPTTLCGLNCVHPKFTC